MMDKIYLDHGATTPIHEKVLDKMLPFLQDRYGNPSSIHSYGQSVKIALADARVFVAKAINAHAKNVIFTSGGTESDFLAIVGVALANKEKGNHIIMSKIEHSAVIKAAEFLESFGFEISYVNVNSYGKIDLTELESLIRPETILISVMYVNNEIGTIQPITEIGNMAREKGVYFHTDAVQALPILAIDVNELPVDLLTISAHKINGPKGVGALYIKEGVPFKAIVGGTQERSIRGGTENVAGIVGFGEAAKLLSKNRTEKYELAKQFRSKMLMIWEETLGKERFVVNGDISDVVPTILNVSFPGIDTQTMIVKSDLKGIAISGGSACAAGSIQLSRIIKALKLPEAISQSAIRISFGLGNTEEQVIDAAKEIANIVQHARQTKG